MAPIPGSENVRHFYLPLEVLKDSHDSLPTNREVLGHVYKLYSERPKKEYRSSLRFCFPDTVKLLLRIWQQCGRVPCQRFVIEKKLSALLTKYRKDLDKVNKKDINIEYLYELFDIEKKRFTNKIAPAVDVPLSGNSCDAIPDIKAIEEAVRDLSFDDTLPDMNEREIRDDPDFLPSDNDYESDDSGQYKLAMIPKHSRNLNIENICAVADRRNISIRDTALIVSTTLQELGLIDDKNTELIVDPMKVNYARKKARTKAVEVTSDSPTLCLQFDGKAAHNLVMRENTGGCGRKILRNDQQIENIIVVKQPGDELLGFLACERKDAHTIFEHFLTFLREKGILLDWLAAIGVDAAAVNTGNRDGLIARFERHLNRPLHWVVCMLHLNERTLMNVITEVDGKTTGPASHTGVIMTAIRTCHLRPAVRFKPISIGIINHTVDSSKFTNDQLYLWKIACMLDSGHIDNHLCTLCPGPINNARWMTTASRILREYCATKYPSANLKLLAEYIMKVYLPVWLETKYQHMWFHGARHLFQLLYRTREHVPKLFGQVKHYILQNAYFAHPENLLLAMIADERKHVREFGYAKIIKCRQAANSGQPQKLRKFQKPTTSQINFRCDEYYDLLFWNKITILEPPFTHKFSIEELEKFMSADAAIDLPHIPVHTQACEYFIQGLSESVTHVAGQENQEGYLKLKMMHRARMGVFTKKKDFKSS